MPPSPKSLLSYQEILEKTRLGRLCGKKELFQDRYQISQVLGRGGFGVTFLGKNIGLPGSPLCVLKQLCLPEGSNDKALNRARARFRKEAKILSLLGHHSQIPMLLDYFVVDEEFYLVQEFIKGYTLSRIVKRYGVQPEEFVKRILKNILPVLNYIHARGVIHRDLKPQNIILSADDGRLVLIDFGSVKEEMHLSDESFYQALTQHFIGTLGFSPPEQFSLRPVFASDIYSLGMTCLFLLTGEKPLDLKDKIEPHKMTWRDKANVSEEFALILDKMIHHDLDQRYRKTAEVLHDLDNSLTWKNTLSFDDDKESFNQWMNNNKYPNNSLQEQKQNSISQEDKDNSLKKKSSQPQNKKSMDKSDYSANLFASYSLYSKLSQAKNKLEQNQLRRNKNISSNNDKISLENNKMLLDKDRNEEINEVKTKKKSFFKKISNKIKKILNKTLF